MRLLNIGSVLLVAFVCLLQSVIGSYVITTPRKWTQGAKAQVCTTVSERSPSDSLILTLKSSSERNGGFFGGFAGQPRPDDNVEEEVIIPERTLVHRGDALMSCDELTIPTTSETQAKLTLVGRLGGVDINETRLLSIGSSTRKTFVQTDKYLYKAAQTVKFRILTIDGPFFKVSTDSYSEVFVETPSGSRIAQWLDVPNVDGLLHFDMPLIEEPEEGTYTINVRSAQTSETTKKQFKIEDYVLPRFEVTVKPPKYILADAELLKLDVCATYTFGQPVKGNASVKLTNNGWGRHRIEMNFKDQVSGCKTLEIPMRTFDINNRNYFVHNIGANVEIEEDGTGVVISDSASISITRSVLTLTDESKAATFTKPELPYTKTINVKFPDGSPARQEPHSVCSGKVCRNITTDDNGRLTYTIPPHLLRIAPIVKSLNYPDRKLPESRRNYMYGSSYNSYLKHSFSPTNSSLLIQTPISRLPCSKGQSIELDLPVQFAAVNISIAELFVQVISRGQIQYWKSMPVDFYGSDLIVDEASLIEPMKEPVSRYTIRGQALLPLSLPSTVSPKVHVLVWYSREDGEVVSDAQEVTIEKCLDHQVTMSWPKARVEQGTTLPLTLLAEPNSLCSLGIVDKSVELLSSSQESLTIQKIFELAEKADISPWEHSQLDDRTYCRKKYLQQFFFKDEVPDEDPLGANPPGEVPVPMPLPIAVVPLDAPAEPEEVRAKRSSPPFYRHHYSTNVVDALKMFDKSGVYVITDLTTETRPCTEQPDYYFNYGTYDVSPVMFSPASPGPPANSPSISPPSSSARTYFPETFLWSLLAVSSSGEYVQELTLPDTITEWVGKAVCVHPTKGLGLSQTTSITTFTPFFIDLTLLPNVKKGEIMPIKISVFNYLETSLPVRISMDPSVEYEILGVNGTDAPADQFAAGIRSVCISSKDKQTVTIRVRPQAVGEVNVTVTAMVDSEYPELCGPEVIVNKVDKIIKPITVEYEGFPREKTWTKYMCSKDINENLDFFEEWVMEAPANIVNESARAWVTAVGDLLGPTLENLGKLIRMPSGCGEQNMLKFAPNIYVQQYLEASLQNNDATTKKLLKFMKSGYQRELTYKHRDGSYSAFGESDDSGSTWLTAFVVKSYAQARQYISVDETELNMSRDWLKNKQLENGCFESVGKVLHKGMKGGLSEGGRPKVLAAYIVAALVEAGEDPAGEVIPNAVYCLLGTSSTSEGQKAVTKDPYELSLIAYALNLANLPEGDAAMTNLMSLAIDSPSGLYWELPNSSGHSKKSETPAVAVETAGYALMAMMAKDPAVYATQAHRLVKWISAQRNSQGGFISTQDTVVALQALAMYESAQSQEPLDLVVSVVGQDLATSFNIIEKNKLLTQRAEVPRVPANIMLDMDGEGCALVQGVVRYNVEDPEPSEAFQMSVTASLEYGPNTCKQRKIRTCASYLLNDEASNMAVIEVALVSGYIPMKEDLKRIVGYGTGIVKRYEVDGNKVLFYIDQFTSKEVCVEFRVTEEAKVENAKPGTAKVYDYYEPEFSISEKYELPRRWFCSNDTPDPEPIPGIIAVDEVVGVTEEPAEAPVADKALDDLLDELDAMP